MNYLSTPDFWSIVASFVSVILGFLAIALSVYFFVRGRKTEIDVATLLTKIQTQAEMLQKITGRQMDRLTRYVTEQKPKLADDNLAQLISTLTRLPGQLTTTLSQTLQADNRDALVNEVLICYAVLYFYTAQANYWAQFYLPNVDEFDGKDDFHNLTSRIVDMSAADFNLIAKILVREDALSRIAKDTPAYNLLNEVKDYWKNWVRNTSQVFVERGQLKTKGL